MPFIEGKSGNPNGRPKGAEGKAAQIMMQLRSRSDEVIAKLIEMALDGDMNAIKIIMERICPKPKGDSINLGIQVNSLAKIEDIKTIITESMNTVISGEMPDDQAKSISLLAKSMCEIDTKIEDVKRLDRIEEKLGIK